MKSSTYKLQKRQPVEKHFHTDWICDILWLTCYIQVLYRKGWASSERLFFGMAIVAMLERCAAAPQARELPLDIAPPGWPECRRHRRSYRPPPWADGTSVGFRCTRCNVSPPSRPQNCGALGQTSPATGMIPNYCDFTTDSAFKATSPRPSGGALVTANCRGCQWV